MGNLRLAEGQLAMGLYQTGILADVPSAARFLFFSQKSDVDLGGSIDRLREIADGDAVVVGLGQPLVRSLSASVPGLRPFPKQTRSDLQIPSTQTALWCWLRGDDRGDLLHLTRRVSEALEAGFCLDETIDAFKYKEGRDLTGYEDGTENPEDEAAIAAAIVTGESPGVDGSSFVAVQKWIHDLDRFEGMKQETRDHTIGRRISDNEEIEDAPESAHVKRTAQESYEPEAWMVRRSMPWAESTYAGLVFVAFGKSFDAFEAQLNRMVGADDGIADALFAFTTPVTGTYFWCPPIMDGRLDFRAIGM
jgi:porphyrinogen peroxidase